IGNSGMESIRPTSQREIPLAPQLYYSYDKLLAQMPPLCNALSEFNYPAPLFVSQPAALDSPPIHFSQIDPLSVPHVDCNSLPTSNIPFDTSTFENSPKPKKPPKPARNPAKPVKDSSVKKKPIAKSRVSATKTNTVVANTINALMQIQTS
ncbi:hypothetical protein HK096_006560, partial [Nowakowskiella sp. JEL0078]